MIVQTALSKRVTCSDSLLHFPDAKRPPPFLTLKKGLNLRERDTGRDLHFMSGNPGTAAVDLFLAAETAPF